MAEQNTENPITRRLTKLGEKWMAFEQSSEAPLVVWQINREASQMIDAFVLFEDTDVGNVPSLFLTFQADFTDAETYAANLIEEFFARINHPESQAYLNHAKVLTNLLSTPEEKTPLAFLQLLSKLAHMVEELEGYFVAYLLPRQNQNPKMWALWIESLLELEFPSKIKILVKEEADIPMFDRVIAYFPEKTAVLQSDIDMSEAMQEVFEEATQGKEEEPGVKLQKAVLKAGQAAGKKDMSTAEAFAKEALEIAAAQNWPNLQVAIYILLANGYIGMQDFETAVARFMEGYTTAENYAKEEPELGKQLEVQTLMGIAGCQLAQKEYEEGGKSYIKAGQIADYIQKNQLALEAWRMAGFSYDYYLDDPFSAWEYYNYALTAGRKLDPSSIKVSTLPYVGKALIDLCSKVGERKKQHEIDEEFIELLGEDWQALIVKI